MPFASGCTLWYLVDDPFDGLGGGSDGGSASESGSLEASPDDEASACGDLTQDDNCGACGVTCDTDAGSRCQSSTVGGVAVSNCGSQKVDLSTFAHNLQAIATANDSVYLLDKNGGVYRCDDDCGSFAELAEAGSSSTACYLTASDKGLYWSQGGGAPAVFRIPYDGGPRQMYAAINPQAVAAKANRVVWTSDPSSTECNAFHDGTGVLFFEASPAIGSASDGGTVQVDFRNIAMADDGSSVAATTNGETKLITAELHDDGGIGSPADFGPASNSNLHIASNGRDVFFTSASAKDPGNVYERSEGGLSVNELAPTSAGLGEGAPIFVGADGTIYWSDTQLTISYCLPSAGARCTSVTTLQFAQGSANKVTIQQIAVTSKHIFFTDTNTLYRVDRL